MAANVGPANVSYSAQAAQTASETFDAATSTLIPPNGKGLRYALEIFENLAALFASTSAETTQFVAASSLARGIIGIPFFLGTIRYFKNLKQNKDATWQQAVGMFFVGIISALGTLKFLEKFNLKTLSQIAVNVGKVPLVSFIFPVLGLAIGPCMLAHERVSWIKNTDKLNESRLNKAMWAARRVALTTFQGAQTEANWKALKEAGSTQQADLDRLLARRIAHLPDDAQYIRACRLQQLEHGNKWTSLLGNRRTENITLYNRENAQSPEVEYHLPKLDFLNKKIRYETKKSDIAEFNGELYRKKALLRIAACVMETALAVLMIVGLFTGVGALAMSGTLIISLSLTVATMGLYQIYYDYKNPAKELAAADKPGEVLLEQKAALTTRDLRPGGLHRRQMSHHHSLRFAPTPNNRFAPNQLDKIEELQQELDRELEREEEEANQLGNVAAANAQDADILPALG